MYKGKGMSFQASTVANRLFSEPPPVAISNRFPRTNQSLEKKMQCFRIHIGL